MDPPEKEIADESLVRYYSVADIQIILDMYLKSETQDLPTLLSLIRLFRKSQK